MIRFVTAAFLFGLTAAAAAPTVSDAWLRALPGDIPAGGYFTLHNSSNKSVALTGATSPACGMTMLHKTEKTNGVAHMSMVDRITVPANGSFALAPGGYHLMCMDPKNLQPGTTVPVTLTFDDGSVATVPFAVKNATGK